MNIVLFFTLFIIINVDNKNINIEEIGLFFKKYQVQKILKKFKIQIVHCHLGKACKVVKGLDFAKIVTLHIDYRRKQHDHFDGIICINDNQFENLINFKKQKQIINNWSSVFLLRSLRFPTVLISHLRARETSASRPARGSVRH